MANHSHDNFVSEKTGRLEGLQHPIQLTLRSARDLAHQDADPEALVVVVRTLLEAGLEVVTTTVEVTVDHGRP